MIITHFDITYILQCDCVILDVSKSAALITSLQILKKTELEKECLLYIKFREGLKQAEQLFDYQDKLDTL